MNKLLYVLLLSITVFCQEQSGPDQIIEFFRHGARSPVFFLDETWPERGKLTAVGFRQHYILGKALARKYPALIESAYKNNRLYMLSSNVQRCIESAGAHLHGLYSEMDRAGVTLRDNYPREIAIPGFEDPYVKEIASSLPNGEIIPYSFVPGVFNVADEAEMFIFAGDQYCPRMKDWYNVNRQDNFSQKVLKSFEDTLTNLNKLLPKDTQVTSSNDLHGFVDTMLANIYDNRTLANGLTDPALITNITWAYVLNFYHVTQGQQIQRELNAFHIIEAFLEQLANFRKGESYSSAAFFSGHDNNLLSLLSVFGILNEECIMENFSNLLETGHLKNSTCQFPSFASDIIVEFYNKTEAPYVKLLYRNIPVSICHGKYECPYEEFVVFARSIVGNNTRETYFDKCGGNPPVEIEVESSAHSIIIQTSLNVVLSVLCLVLAYKLFGNRKKYSKLINETNEKHVVYEEQQQDLSNRAIHVMGI